MYRDSHVDRGLGHNIVCGIDCLVEDLADRLPDFLDSVGDRSFSITIRRYRTSTKWSVTG
jgi:hypothetical protein